MHLRIYINYVYAKAIYIIKLLLKQIHASNSSGNWLTGSFFQKPVIICWLTALAALYLNRHIIITYIDSPQCVDAIMQHYKITSHS